MFPILPILILFLLGPANAERLAAEGRLPAGLLAIHLAHVAPIKATVVAPIEEAVPRTAVRPSRPLVAKTSSLGSLWTATNRCANPACPTRAGPRVA